MLKRKITSVILVMTLLLSYICLATAAEQDVVCECAAGAMKMTDEEWEEFLARTPEIVDVKLNEKAVEEIEKSQNTQMQSLASSIEPVEMGMEIITDEDIAPFSSQSVTTSILPSSVDVSEKQSFPPIGFQGNSGSCTSWSMGYYQMTNNIANVRGLDAKKEVKYRISPRWIHNLARYELGRSGATPDNIMNLVRNHGAPYWDVCDGTTDGKNNLDWNPGSDIWTKALFNKIDETAYISIIDDSGNLDLTNLKSLILDGYVVSVITYINGWNVSRTRIRYPADKVGQQICLSVNGSGNANHTVTIVGYDDNIEIDINGDGKADTKGALKIANSYGTDSHSGGYLWFAYDSLISNSTIPGANNTERQPAIDKYTAYFLKPKISYTPLLLAELEISTNSRNQLRVLTGISKNNLEYPSLKRFVSGKDDINYPFSCKNVHLSQHFNFTGEDGTKAAAMDNIEKFVFDLTPVVKEYYTISNNNIIQNVANNFYVRIGDYKKDDYSSIFRECRLIDLVNDKIKTFKDENNNPIYNIEVDGNERTVHIDYSIVPKLVEPKKQFTARFNYPIQLSTINNSNIYVSKFVDDVFGFKALTAMSYSADRKSIYIKPPEGDGYEQGNYYTLLYNNLLTDGGNGLENGNKFPFYVP